LKKTLRRVIDHVAYYEAKAKLPEPDGQHCVICGSVLPKGQRKYCSQDCFANWFATLPGLQDWTKTKWEAFRRDNFRCVKCGFTDKPHYVFVSHKCYVERVPHLECDHILPLCFGGKEFELTNCQTLCSKCHKQKSKIEAKRRAILRNHAIIKPNPFLVNLERLEELESRLFIQPTLNGVAKPGDDRGVGVV